MRLGLVGSSLPARCRPPSPGAWHLTKHMPRCGGWLVKTKELQIYKMTRPLGRVVGSFRLRFSCLSILWVWVKIGIWTPPEAGFEMYLSSNSGVPLLLAFFRGVSWLGAGGWNAKTGEKHIPIGGGYSYPERQTQL